MKNSIKFKKCLIKMQGELYHSAYRLTLNHEDANDLVQEATMKALDNEDKYTIETNFKGWMYTIMRNIFLGNYRKMVSEQIYVANTYNSYLKGASQGLSDDVEKAYDLKEIRRIVGLLPRDYKIPFSMHVTGFKYREIADKLDLPIGTVKSRIFFARQRLQDELKDFIC